LDYLSLGVLSNEPDDLTHIPHEEQCVFNNYFDNFMWHFGLRTEFLAWVSGQKWSFWCKSRAVGSSHEFGWSQNCQKVPKSLLV